MDVRAKMDTEPFFYARAPSKDLKFQTGMNILLDTHFCLCFPDCPRKEIYFMALIDILTHYGMKKRTAAAAKSVKHGANAEISTVKPEQYARRFMEFITRALE